MILLKNRKGEPLWMIEAGPNAVGMKLDELLEQERASEAWQEDLNTVGELLSTADQLERDAEELEQRVKRLREEAKEMELAVESKVFESVVEKHGQPYPCVDTVTIKVAKTLQSQLLRTTTKDEALDLLQEHWDSGEVSEVERGRYGDCKHWFLSHPRQWFWQQAPAGLSAGWMCCGSMEDNGRPKKRKKKIPTPTVRISAQEAGNGQ